MQRILQFLLDLKPSMPFMEETVGEAPVSAVGLKEEWLGTCWGFSLGSSLDGRGGRLE